MSFIGLVQARFKFEHSPLDKVQLVYRSSFGFRFEVNVFFFLVKKERSMEIKNSILIEWREKTDNWMWKIYESEEEK